MRAECAAEAHSRHLRALVESLASEERGLFSPLDGGPKRPVARRLHNDGPGRAQPPTEPTAQVGFSVCPPVLIEALQSLYVGGAM